ncbi:hypothetical protein AWB92_11570 [Mycobacterium sp. IEC1808]|uniref:hypothetical protein n=1 Tax=Mycobacterium sp. IEC1808 TaxID=1743230 RepID=UPI000A15D7A4|nr:hypothetical protein [Mycobacterium sp. IEC1808]ORW94384.1 hypothetical protein AWB92_11570 [Mycobacterium sp. IEC1808]
MPGHEGGRWDVGTKDDAVYLERVSESDERLFDDLLAADEARELSGLLTKYADKLDKSKDAGKSKDSDKSEDSGKSDDSDKSEDSDESDKSDDSDKSEDSDKADDSDESDESEDGDEQEKSS